MWVSPFRYLRIDVYLPLPAAFRSLSRLSSALSAKASTLRSYSLNLSELACSVDCVFVLVFFRIHKILVFSDVSIFCMSILR